MLVIQQGAFFDDLAGIGFLLFIIAWIEFLCAVIA